MKKYYIIGGIFLVFLSIVFFLMFEKTELIPIILKGKEGTVSYQVEIADTPLKAQTGLMWRQSMPKNQGMLFIFPYPKIVRMWMKNTYIPLDMVFFNAQNQVICLRENARPLDETTISCPLPAQKVLELNAGEIKAQNIQIGHSLFY